ncbi:hypothetical protein K435DRAFT_38413 [Dendrothele bispora CBS 962.96]|nr:hypothetical protein K435DRAFT_38413 [Dendrothele bispora CBS 962.96]
MSSPAAQRYTVDSISASRLAAQRSVPKPLSLSSQALSPPLQPHNLPSLPSSTPMSAPVPLENFRNDRNQGDFTDRRPYKRQRIGSVPRLKDQLRNTDEVSSHGPQAGSTSNNEPTGAAPSDYASGSHSNDVGSQFSAQNQADGETDIGRKRSRAVFESSAEKEREEGETDDHPTKDDIEEEGEIVSPGAKIGGREKPESEKRLSPGPHRKTSRIGGEISLPGDNSQMDLPSTSRIPNGHGHGRTYSNGAEIAAHASVVPSSPSVPYRSTYPSYAPNQYRLPNAEVFNQPPASGVKPYYQAVPGPVQTGHAPTGNRGGYAPFMSPTAAAAYREREQRERPGTQNASSGGTDAPTNTAITETDNTTSANGSAHTNSGGGGGAAQEQKLAFRHMDLLYDTVGGEYVCRECRAHAQETMKKPKTFPTNSPSFNDIFQHSWDEHSERCEEVLKYSRARIASELVQLKQGGSSAMMLGAGKNRKKQTK